MTDLIVDGSGLFARAFFATAKEPDATAKSAVQATLFSALSLLDASNDRLGDSVDRVLFAWDPVNLDYDKGERDPKPESYHDTRELAIEYLTDLLDPAHAVVEGFEADDVVATAVYKSEADAIYVASGDKDLQQLQGGKVHYFCLHQKRLMTSGVICSKWKVKHPSQVALALAILGDKVDGIPGINGWGPVRVKKLFEAVSPGMDFSEAYQAIEAQVPPKHLPGFLEDLERTLLDPDVPGVPDPKPLKLGKLELLRDFDRDLRSYYLPIYRAYESRQRRKERFVDGDGDEEDSPD